MTINRHLDNSGCNTSKCISCNFRFVCATSPYCCVNNNASGMNNANQILAQFFQKIDEMEKLMAGFIGNQANIISTMSEELKKIDTNMTVINEFISKLSSNVDELKDKINSSSTILQSQVSTPTVNSLDNNSTNNEIMPINNTSNSKGDTVMVEKKGLFGKTKWVEEKR